MNLAECPKCKVYLYKRGKDQELKCHKCRAIWTPPKTKGDDKK